ncbi:MAG: metal ABC transporter ATP-binding protein [Candidatus Riflebacteria bacterium]|nr:metal ABC transporter ATP-binding protein [Candidatus Riflebacteria bacterium]
MTEPEPIIRCRDVTLAYGQDVVLEKVDLEIAPGSFLPFVGPNGAGKTTLLRAILGLKETEAGTITTPFDRLPPGFVAQHQSIDLLFPVVARDIVMMGLFPRLGWWRRPSTEDRRQVDRLLVRFNLGAHGGKAFHELSGGMRQKVLIARALAAGAEVLIMDEPTAMLDADSENELIGLLHDLAVRDGKTVLFAQHGLDLVRNLTSQVCWVHRGRAAVMRWQDLPSARGEEAAHV